MPDTPFKAMGRERREIMVRPGEEVSIRFVECERCGGMVTEGDWPFCRPDHPEDHQRP